jgi:magnesium transporter
MPDSFFEIYVVDEAFHAIGTIRTSRVLRTPRNVPLRDIMEKDFNQIPASMDQEEVAYIFNQYHLLSAPVVDPNGRLVGMITVDDIIHVVHEEATEDLLALGGVAEEGLSDGVITVTKRRFSWLFVNLLTAIAASIVIAFFDATIERFVALAILMPIVASMGGNAGTQTLTVAVRALSRRDLTASNALRIIWREVLVGGLNGVLFAVLMGVIGGVWFHSLAIGLVLGAAMIINLLFAGAAGILVPLSLHRAGSDPAISSAVFVTTVTDIIGFFVFLGLGALALA